MGLHSKPRKLSQTYLVFPEWFIVYATDDLAEVCRKTCASDFPYFLSIAQFWYAYAKVTMLTRQFPFNFHYHTMLIVIGISFSVEMFIKGLYEKTVGRATWLISGKKVTLEDTLLTQMTKSYGEFMHTTPWYKFDFKKWRSSLDGIIGLDYLDKENSLRSYERRLFIKADLWIKTKYAGLIGKGVQTPDESELEAIAMIGQGFKTFLITLPRYQELDKRVAELLDVIFIEIAGNEVICLSILAPINMKLPACARRLYSLTSLTDKNLQRLVIEVPVTSLTYTIKFLLKKQIEVEKIYDY